MTHGTIIVVLAHHRHTPLLTDAVVDVHEPALIAGTAVFEDLRELDVDIVPGPFLDDAIVHNGELFQFVVGGTGRSRRPYHRIVVAELPRVHFGVGAVGIDIDKGRDEVVACCGQAVICVPSLIDITCEICDRHLGMLLAGASGRGRSLRLVGGMWSGAATTSSPYVHTTLVRIVVSQCSRFATRLVEWY